MFSYVQLDEPLDLRMFNATKIESMSEMFNYCTIPSILIDGWETPNLTSVYYMGHQLQGIVDWDMSALDVSHVTAANRVFDYASQAG